MSNLDFQNSKDEVIAKIKEKATNLTCPVCGNKNMVLGDGFFAHDLQKNLSSRTMGGQNVPTVPVICSSCGFVREFAAGILGLLPTNNSDTDSQIGTK